MNMFLKKCLFSLDPEHAHHVALCSLNLAWQCGLLRKVATAGIPKTVMGLSFPNPVGLAAGFDKNGDYIDALAQLGFGFIEIGTVTPKPQPGNPKPRLFRLSKQQAIINRMGFNNKGADYVVERLMKTAYRGILGINIGKNKDTPLNKSIDDYVAGFRKFWQYASYITINISSPNTQGLRDLQQADLLSELLSSLKQEQNTVYLSNQKYVPLVVKIAPDLSDEDLRAMANVFLKEKIDGVIATNTTLSREGIGDSPYANEAGGLSGKPLQQRSTGIIRKLHAILQHHIPIIASGGVMDVKSAQEKMAAGAQLVQVYAGLIYEGPAIIPILVKAFC